MEDVGVLFTDISALFGFARMAIQATAEPIAWIVKHIRMDYICP
jgi:hypothetical protein